MINSIRRMPIYHKTTPLLMSQNTLRLKSSPQKAMLMLIGFVFLSFSSSLAQKTRTVTGEGSGFSADIYSARELALFEAKKDAMQQAGIFEHVISLSTVYIGNGTEVSQKHTEELSHLVIDGKVKLHSSPEESSEIIEGKIIKIHCKIRAEVVIDERQDPEFELYVTGFKSSYRDGDSMGFKFITSKDCYMRLFYFDHDPRGGMLGSMDYPDADGRFSDVQFKRNTEISFPSFYGAPEALNRATDWVAVNDSQDPIQTTYILIVALKKRPRPFLGDVTYDRVLDWLYRIPADERCVHWQAIQILK